MQRDPMQDNPLKIGFVHCNHLNESLTDGLFPKNTWQSTN